MMGATADAVTGTTCKTVGMMYVQYDHRIEST
jgi:hypothetical protein